MIALERHSLEAGDQEIDPQEMDVATGLSEQTANECAPKKWKNPSLIDISDERTPYPISTPTISQFPGDF